MMAEMKPVTLYARIGDSPVLNEIGTIEFELTATEHVPEGAAAEATATFKTDLAGMLRQMADELGGAS